MIKLKLSIFFLLTTSAVFSQDSLLTYTRILKADSISASNIYDKAMVWCGERFTSSKDAIRVSDKAGGIISGKGQIKNDYKIPTKKDSVISNVYTPFYFNWTMEIKDGKLRVKVYEVEYVRDVMNTDMRYPVLISGKPPIDILFMKSSKVQMEWDMAKKYFIANLDILMNGLEYSIKKKDDW